MNQTYVEMKKETAVRNNLETLIAVQPADEKQFRALERGTQVFIRIGMEYLPAKVTHEAFYNADADEPGWEIETTNGFCDCESVYLQANKAERKHIKKKIKMDAGIADMVNHYLHSEPACEDECLGEDSTISETVSFGNGIEMDIKCCGVRYKENSSNKAWTEAVLFDNGSEVCCTEPRDEFLGDWCLEYDGVKYTAIVE